LRLEFSKLLILPGCPLWALKLVSLKGKCNYWGCSRR